MTIKTVLKMGDPILLQRSAEVVAIDAQSLAPLLDDPYAAVRHAALRSLARIGGAEIDFLAPEAERRAVADRLLDTATAIEADDVRRARLLRSADGTPDRGSIDALLERRDDTPLEIVE